MKNLILICLSGLLLVACGSKTLDLLSFQNGDAVAWIVPNDNDTSFDQEQDCGKIFASKKSLILVLQNEGGNYLLRQYWGGATPKETIDSFPIAIDPMTGKIGANYKISSSNLEKNQLIEVVTRPDGLNMKFTITQSDSGKNGITVDSMEYLNPNEEQQKEYETLKDVGAIKSMKYSLCTSKSFKQYLDSRTPKESAKSPTPDNALNFVLDKKWSVGDINCTLNGGSYMVYTKDRGLVQTAGGKEQKAGSDAAPMTFEYVDVSSAGFTYKQTYYANDMVGRLLNEPKAISAQLEKRITLSDNNKITYHNKIKQLNFDKLMKGIKEYEVNEEDGFGNLCQ